MVKSKLEPEHVSYKETKDLDENDLGHASSVYEYRIYDKDIEIVLGKQNTTFAKYNIAYYPVYLVVNDKLQSRIGVLEGNINSIIEWMEDDGDIIIHPENMIIYASNEYITKIMGDPKRAPVLPENILTTDREVVTEGAVEQETFFEPSDDITSLRIPEEKISKTNQLASQKLNKAFSKQTLRQKCPICCRKRKKKTRMHSNRIIANRQIFHGFKRS